MSTSWRVIQEAGKEPVGGVGDGLGDHAVGRRQQVGLDAGYRDEQLPDGQGQHPRAHRGQRVQDAATDPAAAP